MSEINPSFDSDYPILNMLCNESVISTEINGKYLDVSEGCDGWYSLQLNANELRMLSNELLSIVDILEGKK